MGSDHHHHHHHDHHQIPQLPHIFMISFPAQGHINPLLRLAKRLAAHGLLVTFITTESFGAPIRNSNPSVSSSPLPLGSGFLRFDFFDDEWPSDDSRRQDLDLYLSQLEFMGRQKIPQMVAHQAHLGRHVTCLINNPFIPWVSDVAEELGLPSAMLWVQSCACFLAYFYYHNKMVPFPTESDPFIDVKIPTLPTLKWDEIPTFLHPTTPYSFLRRAILGQYKNLSKPFCVLMDTFEELERETIEQTAALCPIRPVGPQFKSKDTAGSGVRADPMKADMECMEWLDGKKERSVVYISFGTVVHLKQEQIEEIAEGVLNSGLEFLWVMKPPHPDSRLAAHRLPDGFFKRAGNKGKVVKYSPQEQVLAHPSVTCFMTHCGWNSTMEALSSGVPILAFPQWGDQVTDAKFLVDVFGVGIRICRGEHDDKIIPKTEVEQCLREATIGPKADAMRENAARWKAAAEKAVSEGGSSEQNIQAFVDEIKQRSISIISSTNITCNSKTIEKSLESVTISKINGH